MRYLLSTLFLLFFNSLTAYDLIQDAHDFDSYQETLTYEEVDQRIKKQLQKDLEVANWYSLTSENLQILGPEDESGNRSIEFTLTFGQKPKPIKKLNLSPELHQPLKGLRIAIDPGHMGGNLSKLEEKYVLMPSNPSKGIQEEYAFDEGSLALETSKRLANKLESLGAEIYLTKDEVGSGVLNKDFYSWMQEDFENAITQLISRQSDALLQEKEKLFWKTEATPTEIFKSTYNFLDVNKRAELINEFAPDLTISCHYNLGGIYNNKGQTPGTHEDYTLFFVPGAFKRGSLRDETFRNSSLKTPRARYEFVRLLVSNDLDESIKLAKIAQNCASKMLKLPPGDHCSYLSVLCLKHAPGIYHRNLVLCRNVHSPILYGEPLCQDNFKQAKRLATNPDQVIDQMVEIYTDAVLKWVNDHYLEG